MYKAQAKRLKGKTFKSSTSTKKGSGRVHISGWSKFDKQQRNGFFNKV